MKLSLGFTLSIAAVLSSASLAHADHSPNSVPKLNVQALLRSKTQPQIDILLGKAENGNTYVIIKKGDVVTIPTLLPQSMVYYDGGSADLYFENGERLLVPSAMTNNNYLHVNPEPKLMSPTEAPHEFRRLEVRERLLTDLGLSKFVNFETKPAYVPRQQEPYAMIDQPDQARIIIVKSNEERAYDTEKKIETALAGIDKSNARILERENSVLYGTGGTVILVSRDAVAAVSTALQGLNVTLETLSSFEIRRPLEPQSGILNLEAAIAAFDNKTTPLAKRVVLMNQIHTYLNNHGLSSENSVRVMRGAVVTLGDLDVLYGKVVGAARMETAVRMVDAGVQDAYVGTPQNRKASRSHALVLKWGKALELQGRIGFSLLDRTRHPIAREVIVEKANALNGAGFWLLEGKAPGTIRTYFQVWLDIQRAELGLADRLPAPGDRAAMDAAGLRLGQQRGGVFNNLSISGTLSSIKSTAAKPIYYEMEDGTKSLPLVLFGLSGDKTEMKRDFIQMIIDLDKKAHLLATYSELDQRIASMRVPDLLPADMLEVIKTGYLTRAVYDRVMARPDAIQMSFDQMRGMVRDQIDNFEANDYQVYGSSTVHRILSMLAWAPNVANGVPSGFDEHEYRQNAIEILNSLLETSEISIVNKSTYASLIDASLKMIRETNANGGLSSGNPTPHVAAAAVRLQTTLNEKLVNGIEQVARTTNGSKNACNIALAPSAFKAWRAGQGY